MIERVINLLINTITARNILDWVLPAVGLVFALFLIIYVWRYIRKSNQAGRVSEFNEKSFKNILKEKIVEEQLPICSQCKMPMRVEIRYKDFLKDQGDFLISRENMDLTTKSLVECERITREDMDNILSFFYEHPEVPQKLFKRYRCPNCSRIKVIPYNDEIPK